ncbi:MAG: hypothetical protein WDO15_26530 [Bacteroidota bacterium]
MIWAFLLSSVLTVNQSTPYPLRVMGEASAVRSLVDIMNREAYPASPVEARLINAQTKEYGIHLIQNLDSSGYAKRENRFPMRAELFTGRLNKSF